MTNAGDHSVRPTLRALTEDLAQPLPPLDTDLSEIDDPVVRRAQGVPQRQAAHGAERILSLADRVWLKVKSGRRRGAVTHHVHDPELPKARWFSGWWLGFVGTRAEGDPDDAYAVALSRSKVAKNRSPSGVDTTWMVPTERDANRRKGEHAARDEAAMSRQVQAMIAESAHRGRVITTIYGHHSLEVLVKAPDNITYLAVGLTGVYNWREVAVLLNCIPGVPAESWGVEPGEVLGITPRSGQLIYSTILEPQQLDAILSRYPKGTLNISEE